MRTRDATRLATDLLFKYDVANPPVPVEEIAESEGAVIARQRFDGQESGFAFRDDDGKAIIGVNTATSRKRQRFTVAHELGHLSMHEGEALMIVDRFVRVHRRNELSSAGTDRDEIQANAFAAELLMPEFMVTAHVSAALDGGLYPTREELVQQLARGFDVSVDAMGYRLINLGMIASF